MIVLGDMKLLMHVGNYPSLKPPELGGDNRKEVQQMLSTFQNYRKSGIIPTIVSRAYCFIVARAKQHTHLIIK